MREVLSDEGRTDDFRELECELYLAATDLDTCERIVLGAEGWDDVPISSAVRASTALPMVYAPHRVKDRELVDGGIVSTTNLDIAVEAGAKFIVVVNPLVPYVNDFTKEIPTLFGTRVRRVSDMGFPKIGYQTFKLLAYQRLHEMAETLEGALPGRRHRPDRARPRRRADVPDEHPQLRLAGRRRPPRLPVGDAEARRGLRRDPRGLPPPRHRDLRDARAQGRRATSPPRARRPAPGGGSSSRPPAPCCASPPATSRAAKGRFRAWPPTCGMRSLLILTLLLLLVVVDPARAGTYEHHTLSAASPGLDGWSPHVAAPGGFVAAGAAAGGLSLAFWARPWFAPGDVGDWTYAAAADTTIADVELERAVAGIGGGDWNTLFGAIVDGRWRNWAWDVPSADRPWGRVSATGLGAERLVALLQCGGPHVCVAAGTASMQLRAARVVLHESHAPTVRSSRVWWCRPCAQERQWSDPAAFSLPKPHASFTRIGQKPRSAPWRQVGSIPISVAMPAMMKLRIPQSRSAISRKVPSKADIAILSTTASFAVGASSGTI